MLEEEDGRASAFVLWRSLLPRRALAAVVPTAPCRPLAGSCLGTLFLGASLIIYVLRL